MNYLSRKAEQQAAGQRMPSTDDNKALERRVLTRDRRHATHRAASIRVHF